MAIIYWLGTTSGNAGTAANWSGGAVPTTGDTVIFDGRGSSNPVTSGLDLSAVTLTLLEIKKSYSGVIGTTSAPLQVSATTCRIGLPAEDGSSPSGSSMINLDFGTNAVTLEGWDSNSTGTSGLPTVNIKGSHASNVAHLFGGRFGIGTLIPNEASQFPNIRIEGGKHVFGSGLTAPTNIYQNDGELLLTGAGATITQDGGVLLTRGTGVITTLYVGGTADLRSTGTITTLEVQGGTADFSGSAAARTVTTAKLYAGSLNIDNGVPGSITFTNAIQLYRCSLADVKIKHPKHMSIVFAAL